jgi:hypothetical protein
LPLLLLLLLAALACATTLLPHMLCAPNACAGRRFDVVPESMAATNVNARALHRPVVLLFGDSLTERSMDPEGGWGATLAHFFARKVRRKVQFVHGHKSVTRLNLRNLCLVHCGSLISPERTNPSHIRRTS